MNVLFLFACVDRGAVPDDKTTNTQDSAGTVESTPPVDDTSTPTDDSGTTPTAAIVGPGILYEVYVRSFQDTDGDGTGDLEGVRRRLPYLHDLGVGIVWLMPVFDSPSVSGYDVRDYTVVNPDYGDEAALSALLADADTLGIQILLDLELNDASKEHAYFVDASADRASRYRDRFVFTDDPPNTRNWFVTDVGDYYYSMFPPSPDWNWVDLASGGDFATWTSAWQDVGVDGWRIDAARQLVEMDGDADDTPETHETLAWFYEQANSGGQDPLILVEAFFHDDIAGQVSYLGTPEAPEGDLVVDATRGNRLIAAVADSTASEVKALFDEEIAAGAERRLTSYLFSHSWDRFVVRVSEAPKRRLLHVANMTLPGVPMLYYGEELEIQNGDPEYRQDDPERTPMPWDTSANGGFTTGSPWFPLSPGWETTNVATAAANPDSVYNLIRALSVLRGESSALREGTLTWVETGSDAVLAWTVATGEDQVTVALNFSASAQAAPAVDGCQLTPETGDLAPAGYRIWASESLCENTIPGGG